MTPVIDPSALDGWDDIGSVSKPDEEDHYYIEWPAGLIYRMRAVVRFAEVMYWPKDHEGGEQVQAIGGALLSLSLVDSDGQFVQSIPCLRNSPLALAIVAKMKAYAEEMKLDEMGQS